MAKKKKSGKKGKGGKKKGGKKKPKGEPLEEVTAKRGEDGWLEQSLAATLKIPLGSVQKFVGSDETDAVVNLFGTPPVLSDDSLEAEKAEKLRRMKREQYSHIFLDESKTYEFRSPRNLESKSPAEDMVAVNDKKEIRERSSPRSVNASNPIARKYLEMCESCDRKAISKILGALETHQRELSVTHRGIDGKSCAALAESVIASVSLIDLDIGNNCLRSMGGKAIARMLTRNKSLQKLNLSDNFLGKSSLNIADSLGCNETLRELTLKNNALRDDFAARLLHALGPHEEEKQRDVMEEAGVSALRADGERGEGNGEEGEEKHDEDIMDDPLIETETHIVASKSKLQTLDIARNEIGPKGAASLSQLFAKTEALTNVRMQWNNISSEGARHIFFGAALSLSLKVLDISWNGIQDQAAPALCFLIANSKRLAHLNASHNRLGDKTAEAIASVLEGCDVEVTKGDKEVWGNAIQCDTPIVSSLRVLNLKSNPIDIAFTRKLAKAAENHGTLSLNLE